MSAPDTRKPSSSPPESPSSTASMELYAVSDASEGSGPSETLGYRSRRHSDPIPAMFSAKEKLPLHLDLQKMKYTINISSIVIRQRQTAYAAQRC